MNKINRFSLAAFAAVIFTLPVFSQDENAEERVKKREKDTRKQE